MQLTSANPIRAVAALALVAAGGVLLGLAVVKGLDGSGISASVEPSIWSPSLLESTTPSAFASAEPTLRLAAGWTMSDFPEAQEGDQLERIVDLGELMFVIGNHGANGGIWHSPDGIAWQLAADLPTSHFELGASVHGIARGDAGYVAVGANYVTDGAFPLIWFSPDGDHWTDVTPHPDECLPLASVAAAGNRFVTVGAACRYDEQAGPLQDGLSFVSTDGVHWDRSPTSGELTDFALGDVIATGSDFVATGGHLGGSAGTLRSADGLTWNLPSGPGVPTGCYFRRLVWTEARFIAVGQFRDGEADNYAAVWQSRDLGQWDQRLVGAAQTQAIAIVQDGDEWVLFGGNIANDFSFSSFVAWRSADGLTWGEAVDVLSGSSGYLSDVIATPTGLVALGGLLIETPEYRSSNPLILHYAH